MKTNPLLMKAAIAGLMGSVALTAVAGHAADSAETGRCIGANACKGKGGCRQAGKNDCAGKNGCKGKGFVEMTKAECDKLTKKKSKVHFEAGTAMPAENM